MEGVGSHLSSQMWISFPLPTLQRVPTLIISKLLWILLQEYDGELPSLAFRISSVRKYLNSRTLATREFGFCRIRHDCLASIALLKACRFLNPIPLLAFYLHIVFQLTQHIFVSCYFWPHQKFLIMLSISLYRL